MKERSNGSKKRTIKCFYRVKSPVKNNPIVTVDDGIRLQLNLNTDQAGRTFQDRTHIFEIHPRPSKFCFEMKLDDLS